MKIQHYSLLIVAPLLLAPSLAAYAAGANDLDVTIRMIDRRNANVDRFMNRIQLPSGLAAARADRRSQDETDNRQKDGGNTADADSSAAADHSDDSHGRTWHDRPSAGAGDDPRSADNRPDFDRTYPRQQLGEPIDDLKRDSSRPDFRPRPGKK